MIIYYHILAETCRRDIKLYFYISKVPKAQVDVLMHTAIT